MLNVKVGGKEKRVGDGYGLDIMTCGIRTLMGKICQKRSLDKGDKGGKKNNM